MTANEIRIILWELKIPQVALAVHLKVSDRTVRRWCSDGENALPVPEAVSILLRFMAVSGKTLTEIKDVADTWMAGS
jgi:DNA-binding transcriptional regulator YiaG